MRLPEDFPLKRILFAVALSLFVHALFLWQWPKFEFQEKIELPPLQVKLEPLPKLPPKPRKHKAKSAAPPQPDIASVVAASAPLVAETATSAVADTTAITTAEESAAPTLLPKHAQLTFAVQYGSGTFKVGEVIHHLDITDGHYTLRSASQTTGLVSLFKHFSLTQTSSGLVTKQGLRPDSYTEEKEDSSRKQTNTTRYDWDARKAFYSNGKTSNLRDQAQDLLSLPYHLSRQPLNVVSIPVALSYNNSVNQYYIAVGDEVILHTAMGELRAIPLSKVHGANEEGLIMWLALEYRLLPVKILHLDRSGEVSANMVITDIRVSDD